jgi:hypothetical protein
MEIYNKLQACRKAIKETKLEKKGYNEYSKYKYFTPEQVDELVSNVCFENNLFTKFDLHRDGNGIFGQLVITNIDSDKDSIVFNMATEMPEITATNATQQLGGCMTYTERYLKMTAFGIVDNTLDFDSKDNTTKKTTSKTKEPDKQNNQ